MFTITPDTPERFLFDKKTIPAVVFFNHFSAVAFFITSNADRYDLKKVSYFNNLSLGDQALNIDKVRKLLWNSWSTEYALLIGRMLDNNDFFKVSLHWSFPQAYYSAYLAMVAFHETIGFTHANHNGAINSFNNSVKHGHYPSAMSFYSEGLHENFLYKGLPNFLGFHYSFNGLSKINSQEQAEQQIALFLKTTRIINAEEKKANTKQTLNTSKGVPGKRFLKKHWNYIYENLPCTSIFNLFYRLRIKSNYQDIESFLNADIDFKEFNKVLAESLSYLNFVHEAYIAKIIGLSAYGDILTSFSGCLSENQARKRFDDYINPLFS